MKALITSLTAILILSFMVSVDSYSQPRHKFQKRLFKENIIEKLNLTVEQKNKISDLRTAHQKKMIDFKADLHKAMIDMKELRRNSDLKRTDLISSVEKINSIKNKIAIERANHKIDVLEELDDEQKKIWLEHESFRGKGRLGLGEGRFGLGRENFGLGRFEHNGSDLYPFSFEGDEPEE